MDLRADTSEADVLAAMRSWANAHDDLRAIILTSTRALPGAALDRWSDYDIILVLRDVARWWTDRAWLADFGEVLIDWWDPFGVDPDVGTPCTGNVVQWTSGFKMDTTLHEVRWLATLADRAILTHELDAGYRVIVDKDGVTARLPAPTCTAYVIQMPAETRFQEVAHDLYVGAPYVVKYLLRDQVIAAKWVLDTDMRDTCLKPMLEWRAAMEHNWSVSTGSLGRRLKDMLPDHLWRDIEATYAGADRDDNLRALLAMMHLHRRIGREVGASLGYEYPFALHERVMAYVIRMIRDGGIDPSVIS